MTMPNQHSLHNLDVDAALRTILEGTSAETGAQFFASLVKNLSQALNTCGAWVTQYIEECRSLEALAFWLNGQWIHDFEMKLEGTPCEEVFEQARLIHYPDNLLGFYPKNPNIKALGLRSYMGVPLLDLNGRILGHLAVLDTRPMPEAPRTFALFQIFANRAAAELRRLRAEAKVQEREEKLGRLVDSALDAIIELDRHLKVTRVNPAAEKVFNCATGEIVGREFLAISVLRQPNNSPDSPPTWIFARKASVICGFPAVSRPPVATAKSLRPRPHCRVSRCSGNPSIP